MRERDHEYIFDVGLDKLNEGGHLERPLAEQACHRVSEESGFRPLKRHRRRRANTK